MNFMEGRPTKNREYIPVFGDIHGNIMGLYNTLLYLERKSGVRIDYVLQLGDMGFLRELVETDKIRSKTDIELFSELKYPTKEFTQLKKKIAAEIYFIRGNHDDNHSLLNLQKNNPQGIIRVSKELPLYYIPDGRTILIGDVPIISYGGIDPETRPKKAMRNPRIGFSEEGLSRIIDEAENTGGILLTHQGSERTAKGSREIDEICKVVNPKIHIHGHAHKRSLILIGNIPSYGLAKMPSEKRPYEYSKDFYGILNLNDLKFSFED